MLNIATQDVHANFSKLMDTVQQEPILIETQGRAIAVILSSIEYENMKKSLLEAKINLGFKQLDNQQHSELSVLDIMEKAKQA